MPRPKYFEEDGRPPWGHESVDLDRESPEPVREESPDRPLRRSPRRESPARPQSPVGRVIRSSRDWIPPSTEDVRRAQRERSQGLPLSQLQRRQISASLISNTYEPCLFCEEQTKGIAICDNACAPTVCCNRHEDQQFDCPLCRQDSIQERISKSEFMDRLHPGHRVPFYRGTDRRKRPPAEAWKFGASENVAVAEPLSDDEAQERARERGEYLETRGRVAKYSKKQTIKNKNNAAARVKRLVQLLTMAKAQIRQAMPAVEAVAVEILASQMFRDMTRMEVAVLLHLLPPSQTELIRALKREQEGKKIPSEAQVVNSIRKRTRGRWSSMGHALTDEPVVRPSVEDVRQARAALGTTPLPVAAAVPVLPEAEVPQQATLEERRRARIAALSRPTGGRRRTRRRFW